MKTSPEMSGATLSAIRRRRDRRRTQREERRRGILWLIGSAAVLALLALTVVVVGGIGVSVVVYISYARDLPRPSEIARVRQQFETTLIYDRTGQKVLYQVLDPSGDRQSVPLAEMPEVLINATIAIEDKSFYSNPGFDLRGIVRSVWIALQGGVVQGGSTITQQLVKNTLIPIKERTVVSRDRKIKEIILAAEISRLYSKDQILEWYLNTNFYGNLAYGVDAAAKVYFGKRVQDLTLSEATLLAAIPQNPQLNPIDDWQASRQRQALVLDSMVAQGYITREQAEKTASEPVVTQPITERYDITAPHFALYARRQAEQLLNDQGLNGPQMVLGGGLRIYTTLDLDLNYQVECVMRSYVQRITGGSATAAPNTGEGKSCEAAKNLITPPNFKLGVKRNVTNAATVVLRPNTGEILAMVGSLDFWNAGLGGNFNAAVQGLRQPGSAFKPFVYVTAFAATPNRYTPATMVLDVPTTFDQGGLPYTPRNEDNQFHGPMSVRKALANSYNIPVVRVINDITVGQVIRRARQMGINSLSAPLDRYGLALALGSGELTLLDLTYANSVFANLGIMAGTPVQNPRPGYRNFDPISVLRIEDKDGNILWQLDDRGTTFGRQNVLQDGLAYLINNILSDREARLPAFSKGNALELPSRPAATKTGTTNDNRDAWTIGYTPQLVTGVWVGNNDYSSMGDDISGATAAAPIWRAVMEYAHSRDSLPVRSWPRPANVIEITVCQDSGLLPTADCPRVKELFFAEPNNSTAPTQTDFYWKRYQVNLRNGLRATSTTPPGLLTERFYFEYPLEAVEWAKATGKPLVPTEYDYAGAQASLSAGVITSPQGLARVRGAVDIKGVVNAQDVLAYALEYGQGINPGSWVNISAGDPSVRGQEVQLGRWNTEGLDGLYTLRLNVIFKDRSLQSYTAQVTIDNRQPTIRLSAPASGQLIQSSAGSVRVEAQAEDNFELAYVEFYRNGQLFSTVKAVPFVAEWKIDQAGAQTFQAIAYDAAGNSAKSDLVLVNVQ